MRLQQNAYVGCMLGLASGDAMGAPHEGGVLERLFWRLIGHTPDGCLRWTDDTQMALDLAESWLEHDCLDQDALALRFARSYRFSRGYGPGAARLLKRIRGGKHWRQVNTAIHAQGSFGNGAAMRAPVLALFQPDDTAALIRAARDSAVITHAHPLGMEGAVLIALAAQALLQGQPAERLLHLLLQHCEQPQLHTRLHTLGSWLQATQLPQPRQVVQALGNGITASTSCVTVIYVALRHLDRPFREMLDFIIACSGDVDTIAAMAGALWGIVNGPERLPDIRLEARQRLLDVAERIFQWRLRQSEAADTGPPWGAATR